MCLPASLSVEPIRRQSYTPALMAGGEWGKSQSSTLTLPGANLSMLPLPAFLSKSSFPSLELHLLAAVLCSSPKEPVSGWRLRFLSITPPYSGINYSKFLNLRCRDSQTEADLLHLHFGPPQCDEKYFSRGIKQITGHAVACSLFSVCGKINLLKV